MKQSTIEYVMVGVKSQIEKSSDENDCFKNVNKFISNASHTICSARSKSGHNSRKEIRHTLLSIARKRFTNYVVARNL